MKKFINLMVLVGCLGLPFSAQAVTRYLGSFSSEVNNTYTNFSVAGKTTGKGSSNPTGSFSDVLNFTLENAFNFTGTFDGVNNITFTSILLGSTSLYNNPTGSSNPILNPSTLTLAAGTYNLSVHGNNGSAASKSYTFGFNLSAVPAVPEPEEWFMLLVGFGLVAFQVQRAHRSEQKKRLAIFQ